MPTKRKRKVKLEEGYLPKGTNEDLKRIKYHYCYPYRFKLVWKEPEQEDKDSIWFGYTTHPHERHTGRMKRMPVIKINPDIHPFLLLKVLIDEGIHAGCFHLDNDIVDNISTSIARLLLQCGYRRSDAAATRVGEKQLTEELMKLGIV